MKTAKEHIETAEQLLDLVATDGSGRMSHLADIATIAQSHAVVAQAISINQLANNYAEGGGV